VDAGKALKSVRWGGGTCVRNYPPPTRRSNSVVVLYLDVEIG